MNHNSSPVAAAEAARNLMYTLPRSVPSLSLSPFADFAQSDPVRVCSYGSPDPGPPPRLVAGAGRGRGRSVAISLDAVVDVRIRGGGPVRHPDPRRRTGSSILIRKPT
jgi:hypothetical protein